MFYLKVKQHRHDICHQGEIRICDEDLKKILDNFKAVLKHPALQNDDAAKAALTSLQEVCISVLPYSLVPASSNIVCHPISHTKLKYLIQSQSNTTLVSRKFFYDVSSTVTSEPIVQQHDKE